jgi:nucleotide-binding universal stress UspA family protein
MYKRILVAVDGSATSKLGLEEAIRQRRPAANSCCSTWSMSSLPRTTGPNYDRIVVSLRKAGVKTIEDAAAIVRHANVPFEPKLVESLGARPADAIVKEAKEWRADLIALGTHGRRGLKRLALGSDAEPVLRLSSVPVLMIRDQAEVQ